MIVNKGNGELQKTFVIVGVQRGGTSMVAGVLRELGVNLGSNLGGNHEDPEFLSMDTKKILEVADKRNEQLDVWGWKMPHSSEYIVDIQDKLRNLHTIVVFRNLLAMTESQMKHSTTTFSNAFKFSADRLNQVSQIVPGISGPLMLVDYDSALKKPTVFVNELIDFSNITPSKKEHDKALDLIDPQKGYQRVSSENWSFTVSKGKAIVGAKIADIISKRRMLNLFPESNVLKRSEEHAFIEFGFEDDVSLEIVNLDMTRVGRTDSVKIIVDVGNGFSRNMQEKVHLYMGKNRIQIKMQGIKGIRVYPEFEGIVSNVYLISINRPA